VRVELRPSRPEDFLALVGDLPPYRVKTLTAVAGERVLGIGGLIYINGELWASVQMAPEARQFRVAIHRAGLMAMRMIRASGARRVYAEAQLENAAARRWLLRLGFEPVPGSERAFVWRSDVAADR
jgi:hypothetical protein